MPFFANRVILITGAASGIGRELALQFSEEGAKIGAVDLNASMLESLAEAVPPGCYASALADVTERASLLLAVEKIRQQLGPVDMLVASAGLGFETSALNFHAEEFERLLKVNLIGVANSVEAVLPEMLARRQGHIVGISSLASYRGLPLLLAYCASKAGVNAFMDGLRVELKPHGISVTTVCPGWIRTPMTADLAIPGEEMMDVSYAAVRIIKAVRQERRFLAFPTSTAWQLRLLTWLPFGLGDRLTAARTRRLQKR
jgi:NAD(P)-dependent dehydrogenase (short-subunit alcohol dehydrogenase family)